MLHFVLMLACCAGPGDAQVDAFIHCLDAVKTADLVAAQTDYSSRITKPTPFAYGVRFGRNSELITATEPDLHGVWWSTLTRPDGTYRVCRTADGFGAHILNRETPLTQSTLRPLHDLSFYPATAKAIAEPTIRKEVRPVGDLLDIHIVDPNPGRESLVYTVDPRKSYLPIRCRVQAKTAAWTLALFDLKQTDGVWFPSHSKFFGRGEVLMQECDYGRCEFNRPGHTQELSLRDTGLPPGTTIDDLRSGKGADPYNEQFMWDGAGMLPLPDYNRLVNQGKMADLHWKPGRPTQADNAFMYKTHADAYTRTAIFFSRYYDVTDAQRVSAFGIADDVRAHNPAATQPAQRARVAKEQMPPRLHALLTREQIAAREPTPAPAKK